MCSGCSGGYPGDYEELDECIGESSFRETRASPQWPKSEWNGPSDERLGGFEDASNAQGISLRSDSPDSISQNRAETCEIFVSATHIVEIRVFGVDCETVGQGQKNGAARGRVR